LVDIIYVLDFVDHINLMKPRSPGNWKSGNRKYGRALFGGSVHVGGGTPPDRALPHPGAAIPTGAVAHDISGANKPDGDRKFRRNLK
jgi:hypothetical protein